MLQSLPVGTSTRLASLVLCVLGVSGGMAGCLPPPDNSGAGGGTGSSSGLGTGASMADGHSGGGGAATGSTMGTGGAGAGSGAAGGTGGRVSSGSGGANSGSGGAGLNTGGAGASSPGSGGAATGGAQPSRGPTPAQAGVRFPFPQNRENSRCIYPRAYRNEDVRAAYDQWKANTVTTDGAKVGANQYRRVKRPAEPGLEVGSTVSEGIAYGMLIAVFMGDQALFDDLWRYEQNWLDSNGLMDWYVNAAGTMRLGLGGATDADEDMAFALLMADRQWGGMGALSKPYLQHARDQITKVWNFEVFNYKYVKPGDTWGDASTLNISYFSPYYYRLFAKVDTVNTSNWNTLLQTSYDTLARALNPASGNQNNGLVPAWCDSNGAPNPMAFMSGAPTHYQYDSCRTPFRVGMDWCLSGEPRAKDYASKTSAFFGAIGARNIVDGYNLNGTPHAQFQTAAMAQIQSAAFVGPAGVGAMAMPAAGYQTFLDDAYAAVATGMLTVGGVYYDSSWTVLSLLMMTANFLDYTTL